MHIPFFIIVEIVLISQFNISETVVYFGEPEIGNKEIQACQGERVNIDLTKSMNIFADGYWKSELTWFRYNQATIMKTPSAGGNSPFSLITHKEAKQNQDLAANNFPLFFLSSIVDKKIVYSSIVKDSQDHIEVLSASQTEFKLRTDYDKETNLVFLQNHYQGWEAKINGRNTVLEIVNTTFMSIALPAGIHDIEISFVPKKTIIAFWVSLFSMLMTLTAAIYFSFKKKRI